MRFQPGQSGNPAGRPPGARSRASLLADSMVQGKIEELMQKMIDVALAGDMLALRLCTERAAPPAKHRPIAFALPPLNTAADAVAAIAAIAQALSAGELTSAEADVMGRLVENFRLTLEASVFEERMAQVRREIAEANSARDRGRLP